MFRELKRLPLIIKIPIGDTSFKHTMHFMTGEVKKFVSERQDEFLNFYTENLKKQSFNLKISFMYKRIILEVYHSETEKLELSKELTINNEYSKNDYQLKDGFKKMEKILEKIANIYDFRIMKTEDFIMLNSKESFSWQELTSKISIIDEIEDAVKLEVKKERTLNDTGFEEFGFGESKVIKFKNFRRIQNL